MESSEKIRARQRQRKRRALEKECKADIAEVLTSISMDIGQGNTDVVGSEYASSSDANLRDSPYNTEEQSHDIGIDGLCSELGTKDFPQPEDPVQFQEKLLQAADFLSDVQVPDYPNPKEAVDENAEIEEIRIWAIESNLTCSALDKLLKILRKRLLIDLPKSSKTFLKTTLAEYNITKMQDSSPDGIPGEFVYLGIATGLESCINTNFHNQAIELIVNIDGLPLTKSGGKCFWPILCKVHYIPDVYKPFTVATYCGNSKPKDLALYLEDFINELNHLQKHGIRISGKKYTVIFKCLVADTPARSYLMCTKGHGGYSACERCTVHGVRTKVGKGLSVVYPGFNYPERTNSSFRNRDDPEHHTGVSPLEKIDPEIDMPTICVLDFMHLGSGVVKKLLEMLMFGPLIVRLSRRQKMEISRRLLCLTSQQPSDFQRKTRSIIHVRQWKATEFRFFLLYGGPIVLKNVISENLYKHFLLLHAAFRILCSDQLAIPFNVRAKRYLEKFVSALPLLYGAASQVINMHNLVHIADDVLNLGCSLSRINCFPFESTLGAIKRTLRTSVKPMAQVCRREHERKMLPSQKVTLPKECTIHKSDTVDGAVMIKRLTTNFSTFLTTKAPNNMVLLKDGSIMKIENISGQYNNAESASISITGQIWKSKNPAYTYPRKSEHFGTWEINLNSRTLKTCPLSFVQQKLIAMKLSMKPEGRNRLFVTTLLHT